MFDKMASINQIHSESAHRDTDSVADFVLSKALDIGESILRWGGEPHRIEDTVERVCMAYGAQRADVFALPSVIIAGITMLDGSYSTQIRRSIETENNMLRLDLANDLSRRVCNHIVDLKDVDSHLSEIAHKKPYSQIICYLGGVFGAGGFALFFGGTFLDALAAGLAGAFVIFLNSHRLKFINPLIHTFFASFITGLLGLVLHKIGLGDNSDMIIIGTIMLLIPGLSFGNAVRDLLFGDIISGLIQLVQTTLLALMVAFGSVVASLLIGGLL